MTRTVLRMILLLPLLAACGGSQPGATSGTNTAAPTPDPDLRPGMHHVTYTWGISRKLNAGEWQNVGLGWTNPASGAHELPPETAATSTTPLHFPYSVQFDVNGLHVDNQHLSAGASVDVANLAVDCTITVDGQVLATDPGTKAVMGPGGQVQNGGSSQCMPNK